MNEIHNCRGCKHYYTDYDCQEFCEGRDMWESNKQAKKKSIKMVIDIDEEVKKAFDNAKSNDLKDCYYDYGGVIGNAIKNSIPLKEYCESFIYYPTETEDD